jgi:UDP-GlcNAc:undecaprenyl-phosphate GlcNAc-1-phosphate transferase
VTAHDWLRLALGGGAAVLLAYLFTPLAIRAARRFAFYDVPVGFKGHARPTPYLGGAAVVVAFALAVAVTSVRVSRTAELVGGVGVLLVLGTVDDRVSVPPLLRVLVEFALGALVSADGLGWRLGAGGWLDAVLTGLWVVGVVNAFNLFDNMDGAGGTIAAVVSAGACALGAVAGDAWVAIGSAAVCGACLGFLPHNLSSPARIFLGDGGSLPLGFAVAVLVARGTHGIAPAALALPVGLALVGVPALDTGLVIVSRRRRGLSVLSGGRDHLTHRMAAVVGSPRAVAVVLGGAQALLSALMILATRTSASAVVYVALAYLVGAGTSVVILEAKGAPDQVAADGRGRRAPVVRDIGLAVLGLGAGLSPLFSAYYNQGVWVSIGLVLVMCATAVVVARPLWLPAPAILVVAGLGGLGLWSLVSVNWAHAAEQATVSANLWLAYAALTLLLVVLIRERRQALVVVAAAGVGIAIVAVSVLVRLLGSDPGTLFIGARLNSPVGYVNGLGCVFAIGAWPCVAMAERRGSAGEVVVAGLGAAGAVVMACLALLSESRGAAVATFAAIVVTLGLIPGLRRRLLALVVIALGVAVAAGSVVHVYTRAHSGVVAPAAAHHAVAVVLLAALGAGVGWAIAVAIARALEASSGGQPAVRRVGTACAVVVLVLLAVAAGASGGSLEHRISSQWDAFLHLSSRGHAGESRLLTGAGNRYDYWRIAWHEFTAHPLAGVGAGNYPEDYFRERRTTEPIQNPHSLELQTLAELGLVGLVALGLVVAGTGLALRRLRPVARSDRDARGLMVAATGVAVVWSVDTSGDWMHLLPGVTAVALCAVAALCRGASSRVERVAPSSAPWRRFAGVGAAVLVLAVAGASLLRADVAELYLDRAQSALPHNPAGAIHDARRVLSLDPADLDAYYVEAAGQARFNRAAVALQALLAGLRQDDRSFVTLTLLGDLEARAGNLRAARSYYRRALALDPREPGLGRLAADPAPAAAGSGR